MAHPTFSIVEGQVKATVVSLLPYRVGPQYKPGLVPSEYIVPATENGKLGILIVDDCRAGIYIDQDRGVKETFVSGVTVARSIVEDYIISQPGQDQTAG